MVFVWSHLVEGEPHFTLSQVALNDAIMVVAFAPIVALLLGLSSITVPWDTLFLSVLLYIVIPVIIAQLWRYLRLRAGGQAALDHTLKVLAPFSLGALLLTLVLLFGLQGEQIVQQPFVIALLAVPIIVQVYLNAGLAYWVNRRLGVHGAWLGRPLSSAQATSLSSPWPPLSCCSVSSRARRLPQWWVCSWKFRLC